MKSWKICYTSKDLCYFCRIHYKLVLMFFSVSMGTYLGDSWASSQPDGYLDNRYEVVIENYINNLVIIGSILFGVGLLTGVFTYIKSFSLKGNEDVSEND